MKLFIPDETVVVYHYHDPRSYTLVYGQEPIEVYNHFEEIHDDWISNIIFELIENK